MKLYSISLNNLRRRKAKLAFMIIGLVIAISTVVTLLTVSRVMNKDIANKLDEFGANILIVPKSDDISLSYGGIPVSGLSNDVRNLKKEDIEAIRTIKNKENISIVAPKLIHAATIFEKNVLVIGTDFSQELRQKKWWTITGKRPEGDNEALIGMDVTNMLHLDVNKSFEINGHSFTVTGVLGSTGSQDDGIIYISLNQAQKLFGEPGNLSLIEVSALCYDCPIDEIVRQISGKLPGAKVTAIKQVIESKMEAMHRFEHFSLGVSEIIVFVGMLIVFTNMTASVNDRRREIGVFRAIGFRQTHIMKIILTEALLTSSVAGIFGYFIGYGASRLVLPFITMNEQTVLPLYGDLLGFAILLAVVIGVVAGIYPAFKASRLDPSVALKAL
ncbi:ABC transporter permease [bacterium]|nr:ABC transporter permease [bacterium]